MGNHLKNAGVKPNTVYVAGFSLSPATAAAIENGYVQLVSEAQPYVMSYFGVVQTVLSKSTVLPDSASIRAAASWTPPISARCPPLPSRACGRNAPKGRRELLKKYPLFFFGQAG